MATEPKLKERDIVHVRVTKGVILMAAEGRQVINADGAGGPILEMPVSLARDAVNANRAEVIPKAELDSVHTEWQANLKKQSAAAAKAEQRD